MAKVDHYTLRDVVNEIQEQPPFRGAADREMDYCDGNQLDSVALDDLAAKGMKPTTENLLGPLMEDICGMEAKQRTDWKASPDGDSDPESDAVAKAIGYKLFQAEKRSGADRACTKAYHSLAKVGFGFIEVDRNPNPFLYPYRTSFVHRNECYWDWFSKEDDMSDARWFLRRRWTHLDVAKSLFKNKAAILDASFGGWGNIDDLSLLAGDTGSSTDLAQSLDIERGWSVEEQEWKDPTAKRVCLFHLLTRHPEQVLVLRLSNGRVVEFNKQDPLHIAAVSSGIRIEKAPITKIKKTIFCGPHVLLQEDSEFNRFNFVGFFGKREDRTRVPFGTLRWLMSLQEDVNARITKMRWLLGSTMTIRTEGAVFMSDEAFRHEVGRPDADIKLNREHMEKLGAKFEISRDMTLNQQQYERLLDLRESIKRIGGVSDAFSGDANPENNSAMSQAIEQSLQSLATLNDNFAYGRQQVGELLMSMIIRDIGKEQMTVTIAGNALKDDTVITLNSPAIDEETGQQYLTNDVQRTMLKVTLEEVPSTPTFRQQAMMSLTEVMKSASDDIKAVLMPHYLHLTNIPDKEEIVQAVREIITNARMSREEVDKVVADAVKEAVDAAKTQWLVDQKNRELDIKEQKQQAEIQKIIAETVNAAIESIYSGTQAGMQIASLPGVAPIADQVLRSAGFEDKDMAPIVAAPGPITVPGAVQPRQNTSPMFPPRVQEPAVDVPVEPEMEAVGGADEGALRGIEEGGVQ